jgi:hypothetical protein
VIRCQCADPAVNRTGAKSARIHTGEVLDPQHGLGKMPKWQAKTAAGRFVVRQGDNGIAAALAMPATVTSAGNGLQ